MNQFSIRLKELRKERGLRQVDLAQQLGVKPATISVYEVGKNYPSSDVLMKMSALFNVSTDYLLGKSSNKEIGPKTTDELIKDVELMLYNNGHDLSDEKKKMLARIIKATIEEE